MNEAITLLAAIKAESNGQATWLSSCGVREVVGKVQRIEAWVKASVVRGIVLVTEGGKVYWPNSEAVATEVVRLWAEPMAA